MSNFKEAKEENLLDCLGLLSHGHTLLMLQLLSVMLLTGLLVAVLTQGLKYPSSQREDRVYKQLIQLKAEVVWRCGQNSWSVEDRLCRPCPWDWIAFQGNCYFFSKSQRNWTDSITVCKEVGAQLVIIKNDEEQSFLQVASNNKVSSWMGLSDLKHEGSWQWVDGSPMSDSFRKYQKKKTNSVQAKDCAEVTGGLWTADRCELEKFWICKKSEASCSSK